MQGTVLIIRSHQERAPPPTLTLAKPPEVDFLHKIVGGHIKLIPGFDTLRYDGAIVRCVAFCNEEGKLKDLKFNGAATMLWQLALRSARPDDPSFFPDYLVGDVAILFGDDEFMTAL